MKKMLYAAILGLILLSVGSPALAKKVDGRKYKKIIVVASQGGDYADIAEAYNSISDASEKDRYLIHIMPGTYYMRSDYTALSMSKNFVDIQGSGPDVTILKSDTANMTSSSFYMIMNGAVSEIRDLALELTSGATPYNEYYVVGIQLSGGQQALRNVRITVDDMAGARQVVGGIDLRNRGAVVELENVTIDVRSATFDWYYGLFSDGSDVVATNLRVVSHGTYGIFAGYGGANLSLMNSDVVATTGSGIASYGGAVKAGFSTINGATASLSLVGSGTAASLWNSTLIGPIWEGVPGSNTISLVDCVDGSGSPIAYP